MYLLNSLPARLLTMGVGSRFAIDVLSEEDAIRLCRQGSVYSAIGHKPVAERLSGILGFSVPVNRVNLDRMPDDGILVANVVTPKRLPEGSKGYSEAEHLAMPLNWIRVKPVA